MQGRQQWLCLWPGLLQLWLRGCWWGLLFAVTFTVLLDFTLAASFLWPAWVPGTVIGVCWLLVLAVWLTSALLAKHQVSRLLGSSVNHRNMDQSYQEAQHKYLQGHWPEAETILERLIRKDPLDLEARLMMATVFRRTERHDQSRQALRELERLEGSVKWRWEIRQERERLNSVRAGDPADDEKSQELSEAA